MRIINNIVKKGQPARDSLVAGAKYVNDCVASTLGPYGRNNIIEQKGKSPIITNDGFYTIRSIILDNETENLGNESLANVAKQQNKEVGDGTTTSIVLAYNLIEKVFNKLKEVKDTWGGNKDNVMDIRREILKQIPKITDQIKKTSKSVKTKEEIKKVALTSLEDEKMAEAVAEMAHKMGKDGSISVEEGYGQEIKTTLVPGYKFLGKYIDEKMATNARREAIIKDPLILLTNEFIETPLALEAIVKWAISTLGKTEMVVIAEGFSKEVQNIIIKNKVQKDRGLGGFNLLAIQAGSLTTGVWEDLSIYTGGTFFETKNSKMTLIDYVKQGIAINHLGKASRIETDRNHTFIIEGKGDKENIKKRVNQLKEEVEVEKHPDLHKNIEKRISALTGYTGKIEVASKSDLNTEYLIAKMEDGVCACKAAMEEGIVKGGGLCLKEIADKLEDGNVIKETLKYPYELIQENAGKTLEIGEDIIDPAKVVRMAVEHAFEFAAAFITIENSIAWARSPVEDKLAEVLRETFSDVIDRNKGAQNYK